MWTGLLTDGKFDDFRFRKQMIEVASGSFSSKPSGEFERSDFAWFSVEVPNC